MKGSVSVKLVTIRSVPSLSYKKIMSDLRFDMKRDNSDYYLKFFEYSKISSYNFVIYGGCNCLGVLENYAKFII